MPPSRRKVTAPSPAGDDPGGYASADDLTEGDLDQAAEDLELPSGKLVLLRPLSRYELMFNGKGTEDNRVIEVRNVVSCLLRPKLTLAQVEKWQRNSLAGGDFRAVSEKIRDLSGLRQDADKSDLPEV